ncbi:F0F1 ATP synthase subunit delta [Pseudodonghicola xiamenensis]|uniref:ATP synthase subunit b n=1 Tax=Pseudodonghicola xiamenensis TaxID=337702 RepID=A0A8J3MFG8_9RHOB|nr:F0F1 ATP synthase subunit delta [Pseudodonghicola xiamenensis]GHH03218.1 ATP synthase subunit b [Pseudodonghicola xiamenensis]
MHIDWWTLAFQVINFLVVVWLLSRLLFRPIRSVIEEREEADRKAAEAAQAKEDAAKAIQQEYEGRIAAIADKQRQEEAELHKQMSAEREALLKKAHDEAEALLARSRAEIAAERSQTVEDLRAEIGGLASELAQKALGAPDILGPGAALAQARAHLTGLKGTDLRDLQADLAVEGAEITVVSATELPEAEQSGWQAALCDRFGNGITLGFATDPALIGGAELRFPHAVLRFSVAARLAQAVTDLKG